MIRNRKIPYGFYGAFLVIMLILSYFIGGLGTFEDANIITSMNYINYIVADPFRNWWNEHTPTFLLVGAVVWFALVTKHHIYLNRNFQFDKEYGDAEWADVKQLCNQLMDSDDTKNRIITESLAISKGVAGGKTVLSNNNMIVIGSPGTGKTTGVLAPNLLRPYNSKVILDIKGDLYRKYGNFLIEKGVRVNVLNFIEPLKSDRHNFFKYVEREEDLIKLIGNLFSSVRKPEATTNQDPFWDDAAKLYLQSLFYFEWLGAREEGRLASMNSILDLVNMESIPSPSNPEITRLQEKMEALAARKGETYPPVRDYYKLKKGASDTVSSVVLIVNAMLALWDTAAVRRIFSGNDIDLRGIGLGEEVGSSGVRNPNKKTVLFLVLPDNDKSYTPIISMFYTQLFDILMRASENELHAPLPIDVEVYMDEFYAGPKPSDPDELIGTIRSRNISMIPFLQSPAQGKTLFPQDKWDVFLDNCAVMTFLGSGPSSHATHEWISKLLDETTIDTRDDTAGQGSNTRGDMRYGKMGRSLMRPDAVRKMPREDCIVFIEGHNPVYDKKATPFDTKEFKHAMSLGTYEHPVRAIYNEETGEYRTIIETSPFIELSEDDLKFYREAAKTDNSIKIFDIDDEQALYLNWGQEPKLSEDELAELFRNIKKRDLSNAPIPDDIRLMQESEKSVPDSGTSTHTDKAKWDLSGSIEDCIKRYAAYLNFDELDEIMKGVKQGLGDNQIKEYFTLEASRMSEYRNAFLVMNKYQ